MDKMEEEKKEEVKVESTNVSVKKSGLTEKIRENPWVVSTFVFGLIVVILLVTTFSGKITGNAVSGETAAANLVSYASLQGINVTVKGISDESGLYKIDATINGQDTSVFVTKDGKNIVNGLIPVAASDSPSNTNTQAKEVPKTEKPSVELYVFTYCPYGTQMEKAMIPVVKLLGDKIDFKIRQIGAMHGEYEEIEAKRQLCVEKYYPAKFLDYVLAFAEDTTCSTGSSDCVTTKVNALFAKFGIDGSKISTCLTSEAQALYDIELSNAQEKGASGSPTLIINGVTSQPSSRSPEAIKGAICEAFSTVPTQCSQKLSTTQASAGFGNGTSSGSAAANCG